MTLWQTKSFDASESEDDVSYQHFVHNTDVVEFSALLSSRDTEKALRRKTNSPLNRLKSIYHDSRFVQNVVAQFPNFPVQMNDVVGAYFKSTDGHYGKWSFNTRRLNLGFLKTIVANGGAILVDSTRRGKRMPDALSKTVPLWCTVINRSVAEGKPWDELHFPNNCVPAQEVSSIEALIPSFVQSLHHCGIDIQSIATILNKPLRPIFITPGSSLDFLLSDKYYHVILLTASSRVLNVHQEIDGFAYVQGAADDEEAWAHGLTSSQFWVNQENLLNCLQEEELLDLIETIVGNTVSMKIRTELSTVGLTGISLGVGQNALNRPTIICGLEGNSAEEVLYLPSPNRSKSLAVMTQTIFPAVISFSVKHNILSNSKISILAADSSRPVLDLSIAVTLLILCLFFDDQGATLDNREQMFTKTIIRTRLTWIIAARGHQAERLSRQILKIVNTYLMSSHHHSPTIKCEK